MANTPFKMRGKPKKPNLGREEYTENKDKLLK